MSSRNSRLDPRIIKAIFWDNDGVLVNTERLYFRATKQALAKVGVDLTQELFAELFLNQSRGAWHLAEEKGVSKYDIESLRAERNEIYGSMLRVEPFGIPGVETTLSQLKGHLTMGIVTSSWREHFELIHRSTNFIPYVDFVLTREDYTHSKPDPEPYLRALECVDVEKQDCLVIEDSERGLRSAKGAGLTCWVIPNELTKTADFSQADKVLSDITEIPTHLLGRNRPGHD